MCHESKEFIKWKKGKEGWWIETKIKKKCMIIVSEYTC